VTTSPDTAAAQIALFSESAGATEILRHAVETLTQFGVSWRHQNLTTRNELSQHIANCTSAATDIFIVADSAPVSGRTEDALPTLSSLITPQTLKPVLAIPIDSPTLPPLAALQATTSTALPIASLAIGKAGAINAALLAIAILANSSPELAKKLQAYRARQTAKVLADLLPD